MSRISESLTSHIIPLPAYCRSLKRHRGQRHPQSDSSRLRLTSRALYSYVYQRADVGSNLIMTLATCKLIPLELFTEAERYIRSTFPVKTSDHSNSYPVFSVLYLHYVALGTTSTTFDEAWTLPHSFASCWNQSVPPLPRCYEHW